MIEKTRPPGGQGLEAVPDPADRHVIIVGGGITGLSAAFELQEQARSANLPLRYTLLEGSETLGGKILTERVSTPLGEFLVEGGPDSFLVQKPWAADLCRRLGLEADLIGTTDARRTVFILNGGRLTPLPEGQQLIVPTRLLPFLRSPLFTWQGKLRMGLEPFMRQRRSIADESVADFVRRRLGQEAVEKLAGPLMAGIYAADPERQSLLATFPRYRDLEQSYGSLIRGTLAQTRKAAAQAKEKQGAATATRRPSAFLTLRGGLGRLVEALQATLTDGRLVTGCKIIRVAPGQDGGYRVESATGEVYSADAVVFATPAHVTQSLVEDLVPALAKRLGAIRYVSTGTVTLGFRRDEVSHPLDGFGFVIPRGERTRIFGSTWMSTKFDHRAPANGVLIRCFVGGEGREEQVGLSDEQLVALVQDELKTIMGISAEPLFARVFRWPHANPQYDVGHLDRVREMHALVASRPGLFLAGGSFEGVGLPDCVRQGAEAARKAVVFLVEATETGDVRRSHL